jgi:glycosyltransferase involved in cell wall biosynthesis
MKKTGILIVAYEAVNTLNAVIERIPRKTMEEISEIFVFDDYSKDNTYYAAIGLKVVKGIEKLSIFKNEKNLGYGGNQKRGFQYAIEKGFDIVALLHGDGQYAPEYLPQLIEPLQKGEADMVMGSRMIGNPLAGGMPFYKYFGNKVLTFLQNKMLGTSLSEFHSGYRIYSCEALKKIPFTRFSDDFHFDTEILIQFIDGGFRIREIPIPTYYGDEISRVRIFSYGKNVLKASFEYMLYKRGYLKNYRYR